MTRKLQKSPKRILIICTQRIGDVLLTTPIAHSLKTAWPTTQIDYLVLPGTQGVIEGNPDIQTALSFPQRVSLREKVAQIFRIWRRYDLAVAAIPTDRARLFAWAAAPTTIGFTTLEGAAWLKRRLLDISVPFDNLCTHTVSMGLKLVEALGIPQKQDVQLPRVMKSEWNIRCQSLSVEPYRPYAVVHPNPKFRYKMWDHHKWTSLISWLRQQGLQVYLTGSNAPDEFSYVNDIASAVPEGCVVLAGELSLAETAELLCCAKIYVGPDTAVTHLAAATGVPTIALFGPSNPVKWGPWPKNWSATSSPWQKTGSGRRGNVWLIQGPGDCVPCLLEGCERHINSDSRCLLDISINQVVAAARQLLEEMPATN